MMHPGDDATAEPADRAAAVLLGRDHEAPGCTAIRLVGRRAAVGLARGWAPKPYPYVDPNEDAVACAVGARACLLVVADGHNGRDASHAAVAAVMDALGDAVPAELDDDGVLSVAATIEARIADVNADRVPPSRTTLVVALRTMSHLQWLAAGDSSLLVVGGGRATALPATTPWFLGGRRAGQLRLPARGRIAVPPTSWVVLTTDGYTDYVPDGLTTPTAVATALASVDDPAHAVDGLLEQARRGGAGDNVGVAVCAPWYKHGSGHDDDPGDHR